MESVEYANLKDKYRNDKQGEIRCFATVGNLKKLICFFDNIIRDYNYKPGDEFVRRTIYKQFSKNLKTLNFQWPNKEINMRLDFNRMYKGGLMEACKRYLDGGLRRLIVINERGRKLPNLHSCYCEDLLEYIDKEMSLTSENYTAHKANLAKNNINMFGSKVLFRAISKNKIRTSPLRHLDIMKRRGDLFRLKRFVKKDEKIKKEKNGNSSLQTSSSRNPISFNFNPSIFFETPEKKIEGTPQENFIKFCTNYKDCFNQMYFEERALVVNH